MIIRSSSGRSGRNNWGTFSSGRVSRGNPNNWGSSRTVVGIGHPSASWHSKPQVLGKRNAESRGGAIFNDPIPECEGCT